MSVKKEYYKYEEVLRAIASEDLVEIDKCAVKTLGSLLKSEELPKSTPKETVAYIGKIVKSA